MSDDETTTGAAAAASSSPSTPASSQATVSRPPLPKVKGGSYGNKIGLTSLLYRKFPAKMLSTRKLSFSALSVKVL